MGKVCFDSGLKVAYVWLADGMKLEEESGGDSDGFGQVGSLIYRKSGNSLQLSDTLFGDGVMFVSCFDI